MFLHVMPINDLREHISKAECFCKPFYVGDGVYLHNSLDRREEYEEGRKLQ